MPEKIVVLDGYTLAPTPVEIATPAGEPTWENLADIGELVVHERTPPSQTAERIGDAAIALTNKVLIDRATMRNAPNLKYVGVLATGINVVDLEAAAQAGITVTNIPGYGAASVAQHVFALLLELTNHVGIHAEAVRDGTWSTCPDFSFAIKPMAELEGKTLGVIGMGNIGTRVASIGHALGMRIVACSRTKKETGLSITWVSFDDIFKKSDVVTLHTPLTSETQHLVNSKRLASMKPSAFVINTGRGGLVDEPALATALRNRVIAGAGLDVLSAEPPSAENPLLTAPNCLVTPHNAWATREARSRLMGIAVDNLKAFLNGSPINVVSQ